MNLSDRTSVVDIKHSNLVDFQQNARFIVVVAVVVCAGATKSRMRLQLVYVKVTELIELIVERIVAGTVHAAMTCRPISVLYKIQKIYTRQ